MPAQDIEPVQVAYFLSAMLLSIGTCFYLFVRRTRGPLLSIEPRRLVPWNFIGALPAFLFVLLAVGGALSSPNRPDGDASVDHAPSASHMIIGIAQELIVVGSIVVLVVVGFKATRSDLGLPASLGEFFRDVWIGLVAGMATLLPVYAVMIWLSGPDAKSGHPLVKMLEDGPPDVWVMVLATLMAVVVAPICEEITFRLLLQGWLERLEVDVLSSHDSAASPELVIGQTSELAEAPSNEVGQVGHASADAAIIETPEQLSDVKLELASSGASSNLPLGLVPIIISALLFGLAHFGYGPDPVPLFLLALALGYLYNRTHRIVPSIVAHAFFNGFAMIQLWWMAFHRAN